MIAPPSEDPLMALPAAETQPQNEQWMTASVGSKRVIGSDVTNSTGAHKKRKDSKSKLVLSPTKKPTTKHTACAENSGAANIGAANAEGLAVSKKADTAGSAGGATASATAKKPPRKAGPPRVVIPDAHSQHFAQVAKSSAQTPAQISSETSCSCFIYDVFKHSEVDFRVETGFRNCSDSSIEVLSCDIELTIDGHVFTTSKGFETRHSSNKPNGITSGILLAAYDSKEAFPQETRVGAALCVAQPAVPQGVRVTTTNVLWHYRVVPDPKKGRQFVKASCTRPFPPRLGGPTANSRSVLPLQL